MPTSTGSGIDQCNQSVRGFELLVCPVAHGHDEVDIEVVVSQGPRMGAVEVEADPHGRCDGPRVHPVGRMGTGTGGVLAGAIPPQARQPVASEPSSACTRTTPARPDARARRPRGPASGTATQPDVAAATITGRDVALDEADPLEDVEVVGQQVAGQAEAARPALREPGRRRQLLDDREPHRLPQGGVHRRPCLDPPVHGGDDKSQTHVESMKRADGRRPVAGGGSADRDLEAGEEAAHPIADLVADRTDVATSLPAGSSSSQSS